MLGQDAIHGFVHGFFNWDWDRPVFLLTDAWHVVDSMFKVYHLYKNADNDDLAYDIY
jgi:hypothetical protein